MAHTMPRTPSELGEQLRALRVRTGLTQTALAARIDRNFATISGIEAGRYRPSVETLERWVEACGGRVAFSPATSDDVLVEQFAYVLDEIDPAALRSLRVLIEHYYAELLRADS